MAHFVRYKKERNLSNVSVEHKNCEHVKQTYKPYKTIFRIPHRHKTLRKEGGSTMYRRLCLSSSIKYQPVFPKPHVSIDCRFYEGTRQSEYIDAGATTYITQIYIIFVYEYPQ
jgi:hypothetical protein